MTKRHKARHKVSRRLGLIWGESRASIERPGTARAGSRRRNKLSIFGVQLHEKQKFKIRAGLNERQLRDVVHKAKQQKGDKGQNIICLLESRLICVVYWAKLARTIDAARQLVSYGHILVNGRRVKSPGYRLKPGDTITVKEKSRNKAFILEATQNESRDIPEYISFDSSTMSVSYLRNPTLGDVPYPVRMEPNQLIEYYSR